MRLIGTATNLIIAGLVLDAVAREAQVSKGGLLYHFRSKEALVAGLTQRMLDRFDEVQDEAAARDEQRTGAWARAYLASTVAEDGQAALNRFNLKHNFIEHRYPIHVMRVYLVIIQAIVRLNLL